MRQKVFSPPSPSGLRRTSKTIRKTKIPKSFQGILWSVNVNDLDWKEDKNYIIHQFLNYGDSRAIKALSKAYALKEIKKVIQNPQRGMWHERALNYWTKIFNIKLPNLIYNIAIRSFITKPELIQRYFRYLKSKADRKVFPK